MGARRHVARTEGEQLDNAGKTRRAPTGRPGTDPGRPFSTPYDSENFRSLIAAKSLTSPPTRLVA